MPKNEIEDKLTQAMPWLKFTIEKDNVTGFYCMVVCETVADYLPKCKVSLIGVEYNSLRTKQGRYAVYEDIVPSFYKQGCLVPLPNYLKII